MMLMQDFFKVVLPVQIQHIVNDARLIKIAKNNGLQKQLTSLASLCATGVWDEMPDQLKNIPVRLKSIIANFVKIC